MVPKVLLIEWRNPKMGGLSDKEWKELYMRNRYADEMDIEWLKSLRRGTEAHLSKMLDEIAFEKKYIRKAKLYFTTKSKTKQKRAEARENIKKYQQEKSHDKRELSDINERLLELQNEI